MGYWERNGEKIVDGILQQKYWKDNLCCIGTEIIIFFGTFCLYVQLSVRVCVCVCRSMLVHVCFYICVFLCMYLSVHLDMWVWLCVCFIGVLYEIIPGHDKRSCPWHKKTPPLSKIRLDIICSKSTIFLTKYLYLNVQIIFCKKYYQHIIQEGVRWVLDRQTYRHKTDRETDKRQTNR